MDIAKIKKIQRCGWTLAPVEVEWLVAEVERLKSDINSLAQEFDSQHKMVASRYVAERLMALGSE